MARTGELKSDLINRAYEELRISGLTKLPTPRDQAKALDTLENMADEYRERGVGVNYNFEDVPDANSEHNIHRKYWDAFSICLARRLISTFGKAAADKLDPELLKRQRGAFSYLLASTATVREVNAPSRMPLGSGNSHRGINRWRQFNYPKERVPNEAYSISMVYDEIDDFTESFEAYLLDGETISSFTIESDTGLTVQSSSNTNTTITYRIKAEGNNNTGSDALLQVVLTVTTSDSRVKVRTINFQITTE